MKEAERDWRDGVRQDFPLRADTQVIRSAKPDGRDWTFSTDLHKIFANVANDEALQKKFGEAVTKYWKGNPEQLARETLNYLLSHELYHPIEAPFSVQGPDNDNKRIHQAIRRGVIQAEPKLSSLDQVLKVQASQNGVKDFILDNRFAVDNAEKKRVRGDIIPVWDFLELKDAKAKTNFYTVTRLLYGLMYGPESTQAFFEEKAGQDGYKVAQDALSAIVAKPVQLPQRKTGLVGKAKSLVGITDENRTEQLQRYVTDVRKVFSGKDRYVGIQRLMKVLGPYVEKGMPQGGRSDMQGEGAGVSPQNILQDLLDDMNPCEQQQFVNDINQAGESALEQAANQMQSSSQKPSSTDSTEQMKNLDVLSTHEFYKRNHPKVTIIGGGKVGESVLIGKRQSWHIKKSTVLTKDELSRVNLRAIGEMQTKTRLPWLVDLRNGTFQLNEYELKERDLKDIVYRDIQIDVPDVTEFYLDSSGSMFNGGGNFKVNDGSRWDMLSHVFYGFADALRQGGRHVKKDGKMRIHNFANSQVNSEIIPVEQFWQGDAPTLRALFKPNNGYSVEDLNISNWSDGAKRAYVVVTDGELVIDGRTERESRKMKEIAKDPKNTVALFEIGGTYSLGQAVQRDKNIRYYQVHDKAEMLKAGLEVLLSR